MTDPFAVLGLPATASLDEVRAARRRLAKELHPDHGGDEDRMRAINAAFDQAVKALLHPPAPHPTPPARSTSDASVTVRPATVGGYRSAHDDASFTVHRRLPEAFVLLCAAADTLGRVVTTIEPEVIEVAASDFWCLLQLKPEGLATNVALTVSPPDPDAVRDRLIAALNAQP